MSMVTHPMTVRRVERVGDEALYRFTVLEPEICQCHLAVMTTRHWMRHYGHYAPPTSVSAVTSLKGEFHNPSAHDQTCFHVCFRNGFD